MAAGSTLAACTLLMLKLESDKPAAEPVNRRRRADRAVVVQGGRRPPSTSMKRSVDRILTTHVGSLIRPAALRELGAAARQRRRRSGRALPRRADAATTDVVRRQVEAGVDIVNDGEYGKSSWANYVLDRMTGFEFRPDSVFEPVWLGRDRVRFADFMQAQFPRGAKGMPGHACVAPIRYTGHDAIRRNIADLEGGADGGRSRGRVPHRRRAGEYRLRRADEFYNDERDVRVRDCRGAARGVPRDRQRGAGAAGRRRGAGQHVRRARVSRAVPSGIAAGPSCGSRRSTTRCAAFPRIASGITSASAAGTCRTWPTRRSTPSWT